MQTPLPIFDSNAASEKLIQVKKSGYSDVFIKPVPVAFKYPAILVLIAFMAFWNVKEICIASNATLNKCKIYVRFMGRKCPNKMSQVFYNDVALEMS